MAEGINVDVVEYTDNRPVLVFKSVRLLDKKYNHFFNHCRTCFWLNH